MFFSASGSLFHRAGRRNPSVSPMLLASWVASIVNAMCEYISWPLYLTLVPRLQGSSIIDLSSSRLRSVSSSISGIGGHLFLNSFLTSDQSVLSSVGCISGISTFHHFHVHFSSTSSDSNTLIAFLSDQSFATFFALRACIQAIASSSCLPLSP